MTDDVWSRRSRGTSFIITHTKRDRNGIRLPPPPMKNEMKCHQHLKELQRLGLLPDYRSVHYCTHQLPCCVLIWFGWIRHLHFYRIVWIRCNSRGKMKGPLIASLTKPVTVPLFFIRARCSQRNNNSSSVQGQRIKEFEWNCYEKVLSEGRERFDLPVSRRSLEFYVF